MVRLSLAPGGFRKHGTLAKTLDLRTTLLLGFVRLLPRFYLHRPLNYEETPHLVKLKHRPKPS